ncbi:calmodulin-interacting protein 111 isoform X1 [Tanacetum coccineum]
MEDDVDINTLTLEQYLAWVQDDIRPGVVKPKIRNDIEFEINSNFMRELRLKLFKGTDDEDAHEHVRRVLEITDLFNFPDVTHDDVMLRVFPITLKGPALRWINILLVGLVTTWNLLKKAFIRKYCPPFKTAKKLEIIHNFKQEMDETLYHAWERMLDFREFIPPMTPTQALKSIQIMAEHLHDWYDETTTKERINDRSDNIDAIQASSKEAHLTKECPLKKDKEVEQSKTHEIVCMIGNPEEIHNMKAQEDEGDMDVGWDIIVKDVERLRQFLTPTIHTPQGPVHDKEKIVMEDEHDCDIPLHDGVMQPLTPQIITPPDYVASATNPILNK